MCVYFTNLNKAFPNDLYPLPHIYSLIDAASGLCFLSLMLTHQEIEANPDKFHEIINMRSPTSVKEFQQLIGRLVVLSRFVSYAGDKSIHFFATIKKSAEFKWTEECEKTFMELKQFLYMPSILVRPREKLPLTLYLTVSEKDTISVLVQDNNKDERPVDFVNKVLKGAEICYQKIELLSWQW